ncbi:hypothetical protein [Streptomyces sp. NPDC057909]
MAEGRGPGEFIVVLPARATVVSAYLDPFAADNARGESPTGAA